MPSPLNWSSCWNSDTIFTAFGELPERAAEFPSWEVFGARLGDTMLGLTSPWQQVGFTQVGALGVFRGPLQ